MRKIALLTTTALVLIGSTTVVITDNNFSRRFREFLSGREEVPLVLTNGRGSLTASINEEGTEIAYRLQYSGLETDATQAHIHVGQPRINGGISVYLCLNSPPITPNPNPLPRTPPPCPLREGEVEGVLSAVDVIGQANQGILPGDIGRLIHAIRTGNTYVNVHTTRSPGGEIRSQIDHDHDHDDHDRDR